jgi:hypothetical protein
MHPSCSAWARRELDFDGALDQHERLGAMGCNVKRLARDAAKSTRSGNPVRM